jgi:acyl-CoA synthetase (AMP-forming)/AMP-acid ligase II
MNLAELLVEQAGEEPTAVAVVDDEGPVEYAELVAAAAGWARWFLGHRLEPGERVAFQLSNGRRWLGCYWGASLAALIAVPINTRNRPAEVDAMMARSGASLLVAGSSETPERDERWRHHRRPLLVPCSGTTRSFRGRWCCRYRPLPCPGLLHR